MAQKAKGLSIKDSFSLYRWVQFLDFHGKRQAIITNFSELKGRFKLVPRCQEEDRKINS